MATPLVLASSSPYRRKLLEQLGISFETASPDIDETPQANETAMQLARRLAESKAAALVETYPDAWIIGSDQVASLEDGTLLHKPGDHETAIRQLRQSSGQSVIFLTGLCLLDAASGTRQITCEPFTAHFRELTAEEVERYLKREQPYDCAGSFKMEGLGITLFDRLEGRDPNSLIGLPLIALNEMLRNWGRNPLMET
ncbi:Maf-like protein [Marinobacter santoriniensis NKSG1]|uniref:7-methyl-GTP pyrophosphatase n=1 Tax=Marinobacter santoriniensis NKSG1 TaxID=1288826 RepID=M7CRH6_9GAMM|nr:nucleoside triphosphate pyrophosphatase [Marinobacter santoriniensis]EMP55774.1 Maf-like protein [Marinobacter santoriniensis NKSG1]